MQTEQDLLDLTNYVNNGLNQNNNKINPKQQEFNNQISQLLDYQIFEEYFQNITNQLESTYTKKSIEKQVKQIPPEEQQVDKNKFISLNYMCETHKYNIIMISLEPGQIKQRLFCQICIQGKKLDKLTSLFEVNKKWQIYSQNVYTSNINLHNKRLNNQFKINEIIVQYQKFHQKFFKELSQLLINQNNKITKEKNQSQLINLNKQLYQMDLKEIQQITSKLQQQNQMQEILQKQLQVQKEDQQYYDQISEQFNKLQKSLLETQQEIRKLFFMNDQIVGQIKLNERNQINLQTKNLHINWMFKIKHSLNNLSINQIKIYSIKLNKTQQSSQQLNQLIQVQKSQFQEKPIVINKFSDHLKHPNINLSQNNQIAAYAKNFAILLLNAVCLGDQPIPQNGSFTAKFRIDKLMNSILIGICKRQFIEQNDFHFNPDLRVNHGLYILSDCGYVYSHHEKSINYKQLGFKFQKGEIINVEVNQSTKKIIWRQKPNNEYAMEFQTSKDLHFCCVINFNTQVEIV